MIRVRDPSNILRTISVIRVRDSGNVLRAISSIKVRDAANVLRTVYSSLSASVSTTDAEGLVYTFGTPENVTTVPVTASPVGGVGPFTYSWTTGSPGWTADSPASATSSFTANSVASGAVAVGTFVCTITDSTGTAAVSPTVNVRARNVNLN